MNIFLSNTHIKTLIKLKEIAEKHGCSIAMGVRNKIERTFSVEHFRDCNVDDFIINLLGSIEDPDLLFNESYLYQYHTYWFELSEKKEGSYSKYHTLSFNISVVYFKIEKDSLDLISEENQDLRNWLEEETGGYAGEYGCCVLSSNRTIINGFGNIEEVKDYRVYREGMALKYFGDLVCEYLNEPLIKEVY